MNRSVTCDLCHKNVDDPIEYGEIMRKSQIQVHYYCLLVSTHLPQKGEDTGGILGFLLKDIRKEINECKKRVCCYCYDSNANVKCKHCDLYYHLACGLKNNCLFEFVDEFHSYCHNHYVITHEKKPESISACYICLQSMGTYHPLTSITGKCCKENCWVHRRCMKEYALSAGYYLKCLWCKNQEFREYVRRVGVFVPDRDAIWERKGAFKDLYKRYSKCDAVLCLCDKGREHKRIGLWNILVCNTCATAGVHNGCLPKRIAEDSFQCDSCRQVLSHDHPLSQTGSRERTRHNVLNDDENLDTSLFISKSQAPFCDDNVLTQPPIQREETRGNEKLDSSKGNSSEENAPKGNSIKRNSSKKNSSKLIGNSSRSSITLKRRKSTDIVDYSNLKPFLSLNAKDKSQIECVLFDSNNKIVIREKIVDTEFDDNLIHELVKQLENSHALHNHVIEVSDDDNSEKSVTDLFEEMEAKVNVPKPKASKQKRKQKRKNLLKIDEDSLSNNPNNSLIYPVSPLQDIVEINNDEPNYATEDKSLPLGEKMELYFKDYRLGAPK